MYLLHIYKWYMDDSGCYVHNVTHDWPISVHDTHICWWVDVWIKGVSFWDQGLIPSCVNQRTGIWPGDENVHTNRKDLCGIWVYCGIANHEQTNSVGEYQNEMVHEFHDPRANHSSALWLWSTIQHGCNPLLNLWRQVVSPFSSW